MYCINPEIGRCPRGETNGLACRDCTILATSPVGKSVAVDIAVKGINNALDTLAHNVRLGGVYGYDEVIKIVREIYPTLDRRIQELLALRMTRPTTHYAHQECGRWD
jgi:hypothetical protein